MTSQQRLEELQQQAKALAEQIEQLEDQLNNARPTSGLLGRWAKHPQHGDVLIASDHATDNGLIRIAHLRSAAMDGACLRSVNIDDLTFPEQTTRPQDVLVGEAWLANVDDGNSIAERVMLVKIEKNLWVSGGIGDVYERYWCNTEVALIAPLIPARPQDTPETVTTEEEYGDLLEGSIVAKPGENPWTHHPYVWVQEDNTTDDFGLAGTTRHVLRYGWGE